MKTLKDNRKIIINRNNPSEEQKEEIAEAFAKALTEEDYTEYIRKMEEIKN